MTTPDMDPAFARVVSSASDLGRSDFSLTDSGTLLEVRRLAQDLLAATSEPPALAALEADLIESRADHPLALHLAVKNARSRALVAGRSERAHVSVVFAVYLENRRIRKPEEDPLGEDFLNRKLDQLGWLFAGLPQYTWDLVVVDDGCPEQSGALAERVLAGRGEEACVLYLQDAIDQRLGVAAPLTSTSQSRKGGSIEYGLWHAVQRTEPNHVVVYTDADLSTHLGQVGLLMDGLESGGAAAIGSRREPESVVVKHGVRDARGKLFIYLWKRMLPALRHVVDTQCGFKAFRADVVREIIEHTFEKGFAFDIELLLKTEMLERGPIVKIPVAWIDSEAASTTSDLNPYLSMLQAVARMYRTYLDPTPEADAFAGLVERLDEASFARLVERIPSEIASRDPIEFGPYAGVTVEALRAAMS